MTKSSASVSAMLGELQIYAADPKSFALQALYEMAADKTAGPANESCSSPVLATDTSTLPVRSTRQGGSKLTRVGPPS